MLSVQSLKKSLFGLRTRFELLIIFAAVCFPIPVAAQIENMEVETYYVADANDASDTTQGRSLVAGMKTYRVYLDLAPGSKLVKIFGSPEHALKISSTTDFYNNIDRPNAIFGYQMNKAWFDDNPTIALDSWVTIGLAANGQTGVPKTADTNGVFNEILNNSGGTAVIPGGILRNTDALAGIPLTIVDGYMPFTGTLGTWIDLGFKDANGDDTTIFGAINTGNEFTSYNSFLQQSDGIEGTDGNKILVAQLTTLGELTIRLNVVIEEWDGSAYHTVTYVSDNDTLLPGESTCPFLSYPPMCGCTDPNYVEFSPVYSCPDPGACQHLIRFGCLDPIACNYDATVNFHVPDLCCYPGHCGDRDIKVVCPEISSHRFGIKKLHPNPASDELYVQLSGFYESSINYRIVSATGRTVAEENLGVLSGMTEVKIPLNNLPNGLYQVVVVNESSTDTRKFIISK